jgi:hypothetical protein
MTGQGTRGHGHRLATDQLPFEALRSFVWAGRAIGAPEAEASFGVREGYSLRRMSTRVMSSNWATPEENR